MVINKWGTQIACQCAIQASFDPRQTRIQEQTPLMRRTRSPVNFPSKKQTSCLLRAAPLLALSGCSEVQSMLAPRGPNAQAIADISWVMIWGAAAILTLVMALALYAAYRAPAKRRAVSANGLIVGGGLILPVVSLSALLIYGVYAMAGLRAGTDAPMVQIEVVGNQWWWDVHHTDKASGAVITTANQITIPVGQRVAVSVRSNDVIHSFWVPNLAGKIDLIPGRTNHIVLQADQPGVFRGQCAEFCGAQHARMAFLVVAEPAEAYRAWVARRQRAPEPAAGDGAVQRGRDLFRANGCIECHSVRGVGKARQAGPDLTHIGSRRTLMAGTLENTTDNLIDVITRSQQIKPGSRMPSYPQLDDAALRALATYLESLQ